MCIYKVVMSTSILLETNLFGQRNGKAGIYVNPKTKSTCNNFQPMAEPFIYLQNYTKFIRMQIYRFFPNFLQLHLLN